MKKTILILAIVTFFGKSQAMEKTLAQDKQQKSGLSELLAVISPAANAVAQGVQRVVQAQEDLKKAGEVNNEQEAAIAKLWEHQESLSDRIGKIERTKKMCCCLACYISSPGCPIQ